MPTYVLKCENGHQFDKYLPLKEYNDIQLCECGANAKRIMVPTMLSPDIANWDRYISPASGKLITSYKDRREDMKRTGCVDYEPSLKKEEATNKQEAALEKAIDETVDREIGKMSSSQLEKLGSELSHGADLSYTRSGE